MRLVSVVAGLAWLAAISACSEADPPAYIATPVPTLDAGDSTLPETPVVTVVADEPSHTPAHVSLEWLGGNGTVPDLPSPFAASVLDAGLQAAIEDAVTGVEGGVSVVVHNLADGRAAALDEDHVYYAASTYKMSLLYEVYREVETGEQDMSRVLTLEDKYAAYDLGTLEYLGLKAGDTLTLADAVRAMIVISDTPTAVLVQDTLGAARVDETLRSLGLADTSFNDRDLPATARDMARLLEAIAAGQGVTDESRLGMLSLLTQEEIGGGVISGVPAGTVVAHKSGNLGTANHDIALVWGPAGPYVVAVMTDTLEGWDPVVAVSSAVWQYFAENP